MNPPRKLTPGIHRALVEAVRTGCTLNCACLGCGISYTCLKRWMKEARDPANRKQRALRADLKRVRSEAEQQALRNIQAAGLDPAHWQANAWFLQNSIRGRYLKSGVAMRNGLMAPTLAEIARELESSGRESNGRPHGAGSAPGRMP